VRTPDASGYPGFLDEPVDEPRPKRQLRVQDFDGDSRAEHLVLCFVNGSHSAVAHEAQQSVLARDAGARFKRSHGRSPLITPPRASV
jgi:hypothetical protein